MNFKTNSLANRLFLHFVLISGGLFAAIILVFYLISYRFSDVALEMSFKGMSEDIVEQLSLAEDGRIVFEANNLVEKWGFDALYNNLGFRVVDLRSGAMLFSSTPHDAVQPLVNALSKDLRIGFNQNLNGASAYRTKLQLNYPPNLHTSQPELVLDLIRSDLLGALANEAVMPAMTNVAVLTMAAAFIVFVVVSLKSVGYLVRPVEVLSRQLGSIKPNQLNRRLNVAHLPAEIAPLVTALNQAMQRVEEGFEEQKRFVANAAHELRTPLAVMQTRIEVVKDLATVKKELLNDIGYMSRIVEQLLDLSRAQNKAAYEPTQVSLNDIAIDVCMLLAPLAVSNYKELEFQKAEPDSIVLGDKGALTVMAKNLIENAIKHSKPHAHITVQIVQNRFMVKDSGPGIHEADRAMIFERFWRKSQSNSGSSGLGLAIVHEIAIAHQATILLESPNEMGGSSFVIEFKRDV
ncbi:sensor histidine kinase [Pseudoalteromonas fenneropenaei]|uniref:histidine kinase n=1 Tax=Pseudoalteromonas fenneropenaei TaxID=1737459 RepID=A0ABV7CH94_9GAMM